MTGARLRIAIDARCILPQEDGLGTYARNLLRELARIDHPHQLLVLVGAEARRELASLSAPGTAASSAGVASAGL